MVEAGGHAVRVQVDELPGIEQRSFGQKLEVRFQDTPEFIDGQHVDDREFQAFYNIEMAISRTFVSSTTVSGMDRYDEMR